MNWFWKLLELFGYKKPSVIVPPDPDKPDTPDEKDLWPSATFVTAPQVVANWPVVGKLSVQHVGSKLHFSIDRPDLWPKIEGKCCGEIFCFMYKDGVLYGGPCDGAHTMYAGKVAVKEDHCACVPKGDVRWIVPQKGDRVGIAVGGQARNRKLKPAQRTNICWLTW